MRYFYYLKQGEKELTYQDEEVIVPVEEKEARLTKITSKETVTATKEELVTELESHKIAVYDTKTDTKTELDARLSDCLIRWDGRSPYYELVKGVAPKSLPFLGWPQVSKEDYVEPPQEELKEEPM